MLGCLGVLMVPLVLPICIFVFVRLALMLICLSLFAEWSYGILAGIFLVVLLGLSLELASRIYLDPM